MVSLAQSPVGPFEQQIGDSPPRIPPVYTPPDRRRCRGGRDGWQASFVLTGGLVGLAWSGRQCTDPSWGVRIDEGQAEGGASADHAPEPP
ncbi:hypothetical protein BC938DRAFT_479266 [Jimgerdemannia flammicorona]|uniref:Uncharacterized protein n=1 Tax=Jimgerdemannia flammicorona TaxID=994334 RepID=A0A433QLA4_9FUNG|nr:hypothetical protein BC938DRAFT_479266 [Jimgerdemannia flammicorona]